MTFAFGIPPNERYRTGVRARRARGRVMRGVFQASTVIGLVALMALGYNVVKEAFGLVAIRDTIPPSQLADRPLGELSKDELTAILRAHVSEAVFERLERERPFAEREQADVLELVLERVVEPEIVFSWPLDEALLQRPAIEATVAAEAPGARLEWKSWLSLDFLTRAMSSDPAQAGVRTALLGSLWMIAITLVAAFPVGVASAVYLEEYAGRGRIRRLIQTNIDNLAGVPSIIYGMLGLAIFVRALGPLTSGQVFGISDTNGRTILSAGLTMALLILPVIIINAQEALRAVPRSLREAAFGLGATRWQTVWGHVLPYALPGILTGTILALSRAIGETAPLIVVGASTFIVSDPTGPFSKFTALPIQIYNWTSRPQDQFRDIAAAAILVLLATLLSINAAAILLRNRYSRRMQ
jgi:phosphate transport system permease protein